MPRTKKLQLEDLTESKETKNASKEIKEHYLDLARILNKIQSVTYRLAEIESSDSVSKSAWTAGRVFEMLEEGSIEIENKLEDLYDKYELDHYSDLV